MELTAEDKERSFGASVSSPISNSNLVGRMSWENTLMEANPCHSGILAPMALRLDSKTDGNDGGLKSDVVIGAEGLNSTTRLRGFYAIM